MDLRDVRARERTDFLTTLRAAGPDAPTLCTAWTAADIAAHVVVSEGAFGVPMFVAIGVRRVLPARVTRAAIARLQANGDRLNERAQRRGWPALLSRLAVGPPRLHRYGSLPYLRLVEEWIHHEDVRRAAGEPPRAPRPDLDAALWAAGLAVARFPEFQLGREAIEVDAGPGRCFALGEDVPRERRVRVKGSPGEVLLFLAGRGAAADVAVDGDTDVLADLSV